MLEHCLFCDKIINTEIDNHYINANGCLCFNCGKEIELLAKKISYVDCSKNNNVQLNYIPKEIYNKFNK